MQFIMCIVLDSLSTALRLNKRVMREVYKYLLMSLDNEALLARDLCIYDVTISGEGGRPVIFVKMFITRSLFVILSDES